MLFSGTPHWTYSKNEQGTAFENNYCIFLLTYLSVYLFVCAEDKLQELVLSFHSEGLGDQTQVVRVCGSWPLLLHHFAGPDAAFNLLIQDLWGFRPFKLSGT